MTKRLVMMVAVLLANAAFAQDVTIKLGTLAPQGSTWHSLLKEMAEKWSEASGGKVKLKIYAGGTQGSEGDMVRKMGVGQLQAASITNVGLHDVVAEPMVFSTPGLFDERDFRDVFPKLEAQLNGIVEARGYVVLSWAQVGTVSIFCTKPYATPEAAADAKFFAWDGDTAAVEAFKLVGFRPVVLSSTDIVPSLQTGMITCVSQVPAYVLTARLFDKANQMVDYPWAYLIGATVVKKDAWDKIPADLQAQAAGHHQGHQLAHRRRGEAAQRRRGDGDEEAGPQRGEGRDRPVGEGGHAFVARGARQGRPRGVLRPGREAARRGPQGPEVTPIARNDAPVSTSPSRSE